MTTKLKKDTKQRQLRKTSEVWWEKKNKMELVFPKVQHDLH